MLPRVLSDRVPGSRVGAYLLQERLAVGGMSEVFIARSHDGQSVVVKLLGAQLAKDPVFHDLMRAEASIGRRLSHPNVVAVLDQGEAHGEPFVVMELVHGVDLFKLQKALQRTQRRMEAPLGCYVVQCILAGLSQIHAMSDLAGRGLVHRDVSPSNVMLSTTGDIKLGDFGIAAPLRSGSVRGTHGKVGYMATEQLLGGAVDHRVDLFAVGVVLSEVLTGRPLFAHGSDVGQLLALREAQVGQIAEVLADHPPALVSVVQRALSRAPSERFQSAQEFRSALSQHTGEPLECRQILSALVTWARANRPVVPEVRVPPTPEDSRARRVSDELPAAAFPSERPEEPVDSERTREVLLVLYDLKTRHGELRGRYTFARLVELGLQGALSATDVLYAEAQEPRSVGDIPELREVLEASSEVTSEVAHTPADWAETIPGCTVLAAVARRVFTHDSGMLLAEQGALRHELYFTEGRATEVLSAVGSEALGELLVERGVITRDELNLNLAVLPRFEGRLDLALVELGLLDHARLQGLMSDFALGQVLDMFSWQSGTLRFFRGLCPPQSALRLDLEEGALLAQGLLRVPDPVGHFAQSARHSVSLGDAPYGVLSAELSAVSRAFLARADGRITLGDLVAEVCRVSGASQLEAYRGMYLLTETGTLTLSI